MTNSLSTRADIRQAIHFDSLWQQALDTVKQQSGQLWTDTAEHDPGVTLLQALSYGVSDLAYRHTLPLADLLTPPKEQQGKEDGLFPASFGPQQALTCAPVTADDYRRALLDLQNKDEKFLFRNVQLLREERQDAYQYYFDPGTREFHFQQPKTDNPQHFHVQGGYRLQLELNRGVQKTTEVEGHLERFLQDNRLLCEQVRHIDWLKSEEVDVEVVLELDDDFQHAPVVLAQVYQLLEAWLSPQAQRHRAAALKDQGVSTESIYQGPQLEHGWISQLPADTDTYLDISSVATPLQALAGVKSLQILRFKKGGGWTYDLKAGHYCQLWGEQPLQRLEQGQLVKLLKRGQQVEVTEKQIEDALTPVEAIKELPVTLSYGRHRQPSRYYPASDKLPPCYGLQQSPDPQQLQLHRFMLPFEQQLANGCDQLAKLPQLLSFQSPLENSSVWGGRWPFADDRVHGDYRQSLAAELQRQSQDTEQQLALMDWLLAYAGGQRADRTLLKSEEKDYLATQRSYLRQQSGLNYAHGQFRADRVSAVQRRIAARLGFGAELFAQSSDIDLSKLPFYLIEHRSLLPAIPDTRNQQWQTVKSAQEQSDQLVLTLPSAVLGVKPGHLLELELGAPARIPAVVIPACVVLQMENDKVSLELNSQLRSYLPEIVNPTAKLQWRNSSLWLQDMSFALDYAPNQGGAEAQEKLLAAEVFPAHVKVGDHVVVYRHLMPNLMRQANQDITAEVTAMDRIHRRITIKPLNGATLPGAQEASAYRWRIQRQAMVDRYSFTVSAVFNAALLDKVEQAEVTDAWVQQVVQEELPCHLRLELRWLNPQNFADFAGSYQRWQTGGAQLGLAAYRLMALLALGMLPSGLTGINTMRIATKKQQNQVVGESGKGWDVKVIKQHSLLYVPPKA